MMLKRGLMKPFIDCSYIEASNLGAFSVMIYALFFYRGREHLVQSNLITIGLTGRVCIPVTATNIRVKIDVFHHGDLGYIYNRNINDNDNHCYRLTGTIDNVSCVEVPCEHFI